MVGFFCCLVVMGLGLRCLGVSCWLLGVGCLVLGVGFWVFGVGFWVLGVAGIKKSYRSRTRDFYLWHVFE